MAHAKQRAMQEENCCAFTLIELLVTIAIIAVLASMLLPTLKGAKDKATGVLCQGNLKQLAVGIALYVSDYDALYPRSRNPRLDGIGYNKIAAHYLIYPYVGENRDVYLCPGNENGKTENVHYTRGTTARVPQSYLVNGGGDDVPFGGERPMDNQRHVKVNEVTSPTNVIAMVENRERHHPDTWIYYEGDGNHEWRFMPHIRITNFMYADGHTAGKLPLDTIATTNEWNIKNAPMGGTDLRAKLVYGQSQLR